MKFLLSLALVCVVFGLGWHLRGQWDWMSARYQAHLRGGTAQPAAPEAPPCAPAATQAPKAGPADGALPRAASGNTDGGFLPWNGGDLYMADYSGLTHPRDGLTR